MKEGAQKPKGGAVPGYNALANALSFVAAGVPIDSSMNAQPFAQALFQARQGNHVLTLVHTSEDWNPTNAVQR